MRCAVVCTRLVIKRPTYRFVNSTYTACPCCLQTKRTVFIAAGQVIDEIDVSDGTLVSRIASDLPDPVLRLLVSTSDRGQEYLLIISAANEVRVWDLESRFHLAAFVLGGLRAKQTALVAAAATTGLGRCVLLYSKGGSSQVGRSRLGGANVVLRCLPCPPCPCAGRGAAHPAPG